MTFLQLATLALYVATAAAGVALCRRCRRHRPVAAYLAVVVGVDLLRWLRVWLLPLATGPRQGWQLLGRHLEAGLYLSSILALPAMALPLFLRRSPLPVMAAGASGWLLLMAAYPEVRGQQLMQVYGAVELAGVLFAVGCLIMWLRSDRLLEDGPSVPIMAGLALIAASAGACIVPRLTGATLLEAWPLVVAVNALVLTFVLVSQLRLLWEEARE